MGMRLAIVSKSNIEQVAIESGLSLTEDQVRDIADTESACLSEQGLISFGKSAAARIVREFAVSPYIMENGAAKVLMELTQCFYEMREDIAASVTDDEILEVLFAAFDGEAAGDVGAAATMATESLKERVGLYAYEIVDDDGNVYRWDPGDWHDDVMADGWYGERWEDADE